MIFIKEYKGFEIHFDESDEHFTAANYRYDKDFTKKSIAALKKAINEFIIENTTFGEFKIQEKERDYDKKLPNIYSVIGLTADKKLKYRDKNGRIASFSKYDYDRYILYNESNQEIFKELNNLEIELDGINRKYKEKKNKIREKLDIVTLNDFIKKSGLDVQKPQH